jgi:putative tricarboxylic transport membrane protein
MIKTYGNLLLSGSLVVFAAILAVAAQYIDVGAAMARGGDFMPKICSILLLTLGIMLFVSELMNCKRERTNAAAGGPAAADGQRLNYSRLFANLALITAYFILLLPVGFLVATALYLAFQMYLFSERGKKHTILCPMVGIAVSSAIYYLFTYGFQLLLPRGILG